MSPRHCAQIVAVLSFLLGIVASAETPAGWALLTVPSAPMRSEARHSAELETQYVMGTPVEILSSEGDWALGVGPDGYRGYLPVKALWFTDSAGMARWRSAGRVIVVNVAGSVLVDSVSGAVISPLPMGSIVEYAGSGAMLPDGRCGDLSGGALSDFAEWAAIAPDTAVVIDVARRLMGVPYLWGGTTADALDCSGLTRMAYNAAGILLPRNASAQATEGIEIPLNIDSLRCGDLIFMGSESGERRVTHVGVYEGDGWLIHCSGMVRRESLDALSPYYLRRPYISARRYIGSGHSSTRYAMHPWYFTQAAERE